MSPPKDPKKYKLWKERQRIARIGKHYSPKTEFKKGQESPRKNCELSDKTKEKVSKGVKEFWKNNRDIMMKNHKSPPSRKGQYTTKETKEKISKANSGKICSWKGKKRSPGCIQHIKESWTEERRRKIRQTWDKKKEENSEEYQMYLRQLSERGKGNKNSLGCHRQFTKEHIRKILTRRIPSSLEQKFMEIIKKYNLPYKYVGDGSFILQNCNPDFINTNNEKIAIEVYARYYKRRNHKDIEQWKEERAKVFKKYGWDLMYFDETEVTEGKILKKLFAGGE